jgi:hypothetical protein
MECFFQPADGNGRFEATELTRGPWDPGSQHAGPPAALIAREIERIGGGRIGGAEGLEAMVGRITYEVLRPVPIGPVRVTAEVLRPGKRVEMVGASLADGSGEELIRAQGWRIRTGAVEFETPPGLPDPLAPPSEAEPGEFFPTGEEVGYHTAMDYRFLSGGFLEAGPATVWMRPRVQLVDGEEVTPLQRVLVAADSGNGVSAALDWRRYLFINVDLSVHLHRMPEGEWVCLNAITLPEPGGVGMADSALFDERGPIGRAVQTLLVDER